MLHRVRNYFAQGHRHKANVVHRDRTNLRHEFFKYAQGLQFFSAGPADMKHKACKYVALTCKYVAQGLRI